MKSILLPIDFSKNAEQALLFGLHLAKREKSRIVVLHVVSPYSGIESQASHLFDISLYLDERRKATEDYVKNIRLKNGIQRINLKLICAAGVTTELILKYAEELYCQLVIMGSRGTSNISKILLGSTSQSVLALSKIPLLLIPPGFKYEYLNKKVCFATDFHLKLNKYSMDLTKEFNFLKSSMVQFVHVHDESSQVFKEKHLELVSLVFGHLKSKIKYLCSPRFEESISSYMETSESSLLILLPHQHNFLYNLFFTGHTLPLVKKLKYPVLVLYEAQ